MLASKPGGFCRLWHIVKGSGLHAPDYRIQIVNSSGYYDWNFRMGGPHLIQHLVTVAVRHDQIEDHGKHPCPIQGLARSAGLARTG
jgi:hypothetical protein